MLIIIDFIDDHYHELANTLATRDGREYCVFVSTPENEIIT